MSESPSAVTQAIDCAITMAPITVVGRLKEFYRVRFWPEVNVWPEESAMYAVLHSPGRATNTKSDGGMASMAENIGGQIAVRTRALEVAAAIRAMPTDYRKVIEATYDVPYREKPRTVRVAADRCGVSTGTYGKVMAAALAWLQGRLCIPYVTKEQKAA